MTWADGTKGTFPNAAVTLLPDFENNWWTLICPLPDGLADPVNLYGNIGYLQPGGSDEYVLVDLELDVVSRDGEFTIIDIDEFEAAARNYPQEVVDRAWKEAVTLKTWLEREAEPICATINHHLQPSI